MFARDLPDSVIKKLSIRAKEVGAVNLGQGIPSFPTAPHIIDAAKAALDDPIIGVYPNFLGEIELRQAIAKKLNDEIASSSASWRTPRNDPGSAIESQNILVTVGAMEATAAAILALVENGDRIGVITPDYCNHFPQIQLARGKVIEIPMIESDHWMLDLSKIEVEAQKGLKLLIITNPNNPTGAVVFSEEIKKLVNLAKKYDFWILSDETYNFLSYDQPFISLLNYWHDCKKLLIVRSFSKEYAMTGWRVGYIIGQKEAIGEISKVHDALVGTAAKISQRAATAALTGSGKNVAEYQKILKHRRDLGMSLLEKISGISFVKPLGAYYFFLKYTANLSSIEMSDKILTEAKVAVVPGSVFGQGGENHLRISFAVEDNLLVEALKRLKDFFKVAKFKK